MITKAAAMEASLGARAAKRPIVVDLRDTHKSIRQRV
jgi:hypothetical protein